jgi:hypothetical protein
MIYDPMVRLAQTMHLSCSDPNTISETERNEIPHESRHLGVLSALSENDFRAYGSFGTNSTPI